MYLFTPAFVFFRAEEQMQMHYGKRAPFRNDGSSLGTVTENCTQNNADARLLIVESKANYYVEN